MIGIYKITNKLNNKSYIGKSIDVEKRLKNHKSAVFSNCGREHDTPIHKSMRIHGIENFTFNIIEECSIDQLDEREVFWIKYYNSYLKGYNQTDGGSSPISVKRAVCGFSIPEGKKICEYSSVTEAECEYSRGIYETCLNFNKNKTAQGLCWFFKEDIENLTQEEIKQKIYNRYPYLCCQLDKNGKLIKIWKDTKTACIENNFKSIGNIISCCLNNRDLANGFQWCYIKDLNKRVNVKYKNKSTYNRKAVNQYSKDGKFLKTWTSITEAARELSLQDSKISSVCKGTRKSTGGFVWKYAD